MKLSSLLSLLLLCCSCSTNLVYLTITEPAPVSVPANLKRVGILNRTLPSENNKVQNTLDLILSEKGPELDLAGSFEEIRGLNDALVQNPRFTSILNLDKEKMFSPGPGTFPSPLSWDQIDRICKLYNVDGLFVLELFHTDSKISYSTTPTQVKTPLGNIPAIEHHANMVTTVNSGWRIYDPAGKRIVDEYPFSESLTFQGVGINPAAAAAALMGRKEAVKQTGYQGGQTYAYRILPYSLRVNREYYVKGNDQFELATRMARVGEWDQAGMIWKKETNNPSIKIAGRACYNMAIINEINGDLEAALDWAQKAYIMDNKRLSLHYVNILKNRKSRNERLKRQVEASEK